MLRETVRIGIFVVSFVVAGCSATRPGEYPRDFELFFEDGELDTVELKQDVAGVNTTQDVTIERERIGARFAFGGDTTRGFFQVFSEEWGAYDAFGAGGGVKGAPVISKPGGGEVSLRIPFRADLSAAAGDLDTGTMDRSLIYAELHAEVGFGADWRGLRPSVGVALSSFAGVITIDDLFTQEDDPELTGFNAGFFVDLTYKHEKFPMYGHIRFLMGDYEATTFGIGVNF